jgi:hypothetical protein
VLYDGKTLHIAVHAFDVQPSAIVAPEMRRDSDRLLDEDNFEVILDTFNDSRNLRFNFIYRPGSDIYIVYSDLQQTGLRRRRLPPAIASWS